MKEITGCLVKGALKQIQICFSTSIKTEEAGIEPAIANLSNQRF